MFFNQESAHGSRRQDDGIKKKLYQGGTFCFSQALKKKVTSWTTSANRTKPGPSFQL